MEPARASRSVVVTGGGRGVGRAVAERLLRDGAHVVAIDLDAGALDWLAAHPGAVPVVGSAADEAVAEEAADRAEGAAPLTGGVNNAALFRDASVHTSPAREVLGLVETNLAPAVVGATTAVRRFLAARTGGRDRQRLLPPGPAGRSRLHPLRHGEGRGRRPHARARRRVRGAGG